MSKRRGGRKRSRKIQFLSLLIQRKFALKFFNAGVYTNNQQIYNSKGLYAHKSYISNNFKKGISEHKWVLHYEGYDYEKLSFFI